MLKIYKGLGNTNHDDSVIILGDRGIQKTNLPRPVSLTLNHTQSQGKLACHQEVT